MKKRMLCMLLTLVLVLGLLPARTQAASKKLVALTFDDGPGAYTERLLNGLKDNGAKVTFFMLGSNASNNTSLVRRAFDEGHEVACHSWDHPDLTNLSNSSIQSQFSKSYTALNKACGSGTTYLTRAPYGNANERVKSTVNTPFIYWSVDTEDWKDRNASTVRDRIVNQAFDGAIILVHDIHSTTVDGALQAIPILQSKGYEFVTVSELFRRRDVKLKNATTYTKCSNTGTDLGAVEKPKITYEAVSGGVKVSISAQSGATIYYNTDGSRITSESKKYTGPFTLTKAATVTAVAAFKLNGGRSATVTRDIPLVVRRPVAATPTITVENGVLSLKTTSTGRYRLLYTLDDTDPDVLARIYYGPVTINKGTVVRAVTGGDDYEHSPETKVYYSTRGNVFSDVFPNSWYCDAIDRAASKKLMNGVGGYAMDPNGTVTRGMMVTLLYRYAGEPLKNGYDRTNKFPDVPEKKYYSAAVEWAYRNNLVGGYPDGTFCPNSTITRQELCKLICGFLAYEGKPISGSTDVLKSFKDRSSVSNWAKSYVCAAVSEGLVKGDAAGTLRPQGTTTRAEAATLLMRLLDR